MTDAYGLGRADGLPVAIEIVRQLEEGVSARLARPAPRRTREARTVRHKAFQVAGARIGTALRRQTKNRGEDIAGKLKELAL